MNTLTDTAASADGAWKSSNHQALEPDLLLPPHADKDDAGATELMKRVVRGAHTTIDEFADSAAPTVRRVGETVSGAQDVLQAKATQLRATGDEWAEGVRATVRGYPLACVLAALALGALIGRARR